MANLVWFRADLRTRDNLALSEACRDRIAPVFGVFFVCPSQWKSHDWGSRRVGFVIRNLVELDKSLKKLNIPLAILHSDWFRDVPKALIVHAKQLNCTSIFFNNEYEINESRRDQAVEDSASANGIKIHRFDDQVIIPPGRVRTKQGTWYTVFTPFQRSWMEALEEIGIGDPTPAPKKRSEMPQSGPSSSFHPDGFDTDCERADLWPAGEKEAYRRLDEFFQDRAPHYATFRDLPGTNGTSLLSPYLAAGVISPRDCLRAAIAANKNSCREIHGGSQGAAKWISELIWREFYKHLLVAFPRLCMGRAFRPDMDSVQWRYDENDFGHWCRGETGFPIVDAAMRQLQRTGWMHNRLRMIVAMFLTKNLLIDWRWGERYFMQQLVDGDLAANNGGWQWSASTGTDAAPYFRIFNPMTQAERFDPEASFIRRFVPELSKLPAATIHGQTGAAVSARTGAGYPAPMVDLTTSRRRAIEAFRAV